MHCFKITKMLFDQLPQDVYIELIRHLDYLSVPQFCQLNRRMAALTSTVLKGAIEQRRQRLNELFLNYPGSQKSLAINNQIIKLPLPLVGSHLQRRRWDRRYKQETYTDYIVTSFGLQQNEYGLLFMYVKKIVKPSLRFALLVPEEELIVLYSGGWKFNDFDHALFVGLKN